MTLEQKSEIKIVPSEIEIGRAAAKRFISMARESLSKRGKFIVALSGGKTPTAMYRILAQRGNAIPWNHVFFFWSDERCVPVEHPESNAGTALSTLLRPLQIASEQIFVPIESDESASILAERYEQRIYGFFNTLPGVPPRFDLIVLGLGEDGHTASLFPGTVALEERQKIVAVNWVEKLSSWRLTFTFPLLNQARHVLFMAAGSRKAMIVKQIIEDGNPCYPASHIRPATGSVIWIIDDPAAAELSNK